MRPDNQELARLYVDEQMSQRAIARRFGVTDVSVGRWLRAAGIPARPKSEATKLGMRGWKPSEDHKDKLRRNLAVARISSQKLSSRQLRSEALKKTWAERGHSRLGKSWTPEQREKHMATRSAPEYRKKLSEWQKGEKSPNWKGGYEQRAPRGYEWIERRKECYARDNWTCQECGVKCRNKVRIQAHHIIPRRLGGTDDLENLVTLCASCHVKIERCQDAMSS